MTRVSVIVRFKNEAAHLQTVLRSIRAQRCDHQIEIVAIDNSSTDGSAQIAARYADLTLNYAHYQPGVILNDAIAACSGDAIVMLSAHAIPASRSWLADLTAWLPNSEVIATYGAQVYPLNSRFLDKRDLDIFSGLRPRAEFSDSDFWNANSVLPRSSWQKQQFDTTVIELEDHQWTKELLPQGGYWVRFEPAALVYHYGHESRNDRSYLPPSAQSDSERITASIRVLQDPEEPWPAVMSAGLTLGSLCHLPEATRAIPALGAALAGHPDFDVRWRVASALGRIGTTAAAPFLVAGLGDRSFYPRDESAWSLGRIGGAAIADLTGALAGMDARTRPFAALALGLSGVPGTAERAVGLLADGLACDDPDVLRDSVYFLGEVAGLPGAGRLRDAVLAALRSGHDDAVRGAAWCWGMLAASKAADLDERPVIELARYHPLETVRFEAVVALGKAARLRQGWSAWREVGRALAEDGSGRVRYGAMQSLRLGVSAGCDGRAQALAHDSDTDLGVMFERELLLSHGDGAGSG